jgi:hypothetical protein
MSFVFSPTLIPKERRAMKFSFGLTLLVLASLPAMSFGQNAAPLWNTAAAQRHAWITDGKPYSIRHDLGASALAYDSEAHALYTACEKYPRLLRFDTPLSTNRRPLSPPRFPSMPSISKP